MQKDDSESPDFEDPHQEHVELPIEHLDEVAGPVELSEEDMADALGHDYFVSVIKTCQREGHFKKWNDFARVHVDGTADPAWLTNLDLVRFLRTFGLPFSFEDSLKLGEANNSQGDTVVSERPWKSKAEKAGAPSMQSWRHGDWECPQCQAHVFGKKPRCYSCGYWRTSDDAGYVFTEYQGGGKATEPEHSESGGSKWWKDKHESWSTWEDKAVSPMPTPLVCSASPLPNGAPRGVAKGPPLTPSQKRSLPPRSPSNYWYSGQESVCSGSSAA